MILNRPEFVETLAKVSAALSARDLLPVLSCFCFDGKQVTAFDDVVALRLPFVSEFTGGVHGKVLLDFLKASKAKEVDIGPKAEEITTMGVKAGRAKLALPIIPADDFLFEVPSVKRAVTILISEKFLDALAQASICMGRDPSNPWRLGITLRGVSDPKSGAYLYSSDNKTAARVFLPGDFGDVETILPPRFCELLADIGKQDPPVNLALTGEWALATFKSGLKLFSRTIAEIDVKSFTGAFAAVRGLETVEMPSGLGRCLERALVVLPFSKEPYTRIRVKDGNLRLHTESSQGEINDSVPIAKEQGEADVVVAPDLMHRTMPHVGAIGITPGCVVLKGKNLVYLVTTFEGGSD